MNRLVLIGNGFDLAHGLKTRYEDFINWYWGQWGFRLLNGKDKKESDGLCSFTLKDEIQLRSWFYVWGYHYTRTNPLDPWKPNDVVTLARNDKELCEFKFEGDLLKKICHSISSKKWVDIENDYYSLLERRIAPINDCSEKDVVILNLQMDILRNRLVEYLKQEQDKGVVIIDGIKEKLLSSIKEEEIAVSYKSRQNNSSIYEMNPVATMLLNFNYTNTPEQYIIDQSTMSINYIHGKIDNPQGVIFGYGDELDDSFKKLQYLNENECLRHIKSVHYLESNCYRKMLEFIESDAFQIVIMGHSCGNSDRTLLNTLFEHKNCVSIKPYYHQKDGQDNYIDIIQNISRNFTDMKLMRDRVVNKEYCEALVPEIIERTV